jgi:hypothetical protein
MVDLLKLTASRLRLKPSVFSIAEEALARKDARADFVSFSAGYLKAGASAEGGKYPDDIGLS